MSAVHGQASAEYAGLLALAVVLGAALALIAGPPLVGIVRTALVAALSSEAPAPAVVTASAADVADVQSALAPGADGLTPDAALLSLARRHGETRAGEVADALLLDAARVAAPWLGTPRSYRAWTRLEDGPYELVAATDEDRDDERPTGPPVVSWIGVGDQRRALAAAFAHHVEPGTVALDLISLIPGGSLARGAVAVGASRAVKEALKELPETIHAVHAGSGVIDLIHPGGERDVPPAMRIGDVVVEWPVHRTFWRGGRQDDSPRVALGHGLGSEPPASDYVHVVFLRPGAGGLAVVAEGFGN